MAEQHHAGAASAVDPAALPRQRVAARDGGRAGLTSAEVDDRVRSGLVNDLPQRTSRSVAEIVRANVLTRFNAILGALLAVILVVGPLQDALFGLILVINTGVGIVQELRAKRTLDRLFLVSAPKARVVRDGVAQEVAASAVVVDDLVDLGPGDQVVVDGTVTQSAGLEIDESLVSGESEPVGKDPGDVLLSGSFVAAGAGRYVATKVGAAAYAAALAAEARRFTLVSSDLRNGINRILRFITWVMVPTAALLVWSQLTRDDPVDDAVRASVAGVVTMVPQGLVLLTSIAFAVGVVRLARRRVVVQELPAIEGLARVDVLCIDKTGTLTTGAFTVRLLERLGPPDQPAEAALGALAAADPRPNASLQALGTAYPPPTGWHPVATVPFSSARKWSGADFGGHGTWLLGAPEVLSTDVAVRAAAERQAAAGGRVLLLVAAPDGLTGDSLPARVQPVALVVLAEQVRPDAAETLRYFATEDVTVKVLSGDHPRTVASVAAGLGLTGADRSVDAREMPDDPDRIADVMEECNVFGRVTPQQKRAMVKALQSRGHVVAMTGDGVNDVLALKDADMGVAMGSGSGAARAVGQLVLLDNTFDALPGVVGEGRRVLGNIERVANLFLVKTTYATLLALAVGAAQMSFPFLPRHMTLVDAFTIGIPGFFLALGPNLRRARPGFVRRVLRFSVPAGIVAGVVTFTAYRLARVEPGVSRTEASTVAAIVLFGAALWVLGLLVRPVTRLRALLVALMAVGFVATLAVPLAREVLALDVPSALLCLEAVGIVAVAGVALEVGWRLSASARGSPQQ